MARQEAVIPREYRFSDISTRTFSPGIAAADCIWLSGSTAGRTDASGRTVVEGDLLAQAKIVLDKIRLVVEAGRLKMADLASMVQYLTPAAIEDLPRLSAWYREVFGGTLPEIGTIVVKRLLRPTALIEIESVARRAPGAAYRQLAVSDVDLTQTRARATERLEAMGASWRDVVRSTELMTSAELARTAGRPANPASTLQVVMPRVLDADAGAQIQMTVARGPQERLVCLSAVGDPARGGVDAQCRDIYSRLAAQLTAVGARLDAVVKTTEYVTSAALAEYRKTAGVRREVFGAPFPAATGVVCEALVDPDAQIAIEVVALGEAA